MSAVINADKAKTATLTTIQKLGTKARNRNNFCTKGIPHLLPVKYVENIPHSIIDSLSIVIA
jgi:hypothetical protein